MAEEELTGEAIRELINAVNNLSGAIQVSSSSTDMYLIALIPASIAMIGIFVAFFRFNQTQRQSKNLEFMKQLEYYDTELSNIGINYGKSDKKFDNCHRRAVQTLLILNRISFLREKKLVNPDFVYYFENDFNHGRTLLNWLNFTERRTANWNNVYVNFEKIIDTVKFSASHVILHTEFYYYVYQFNENSSYDPMKDTHDPKSYRMTQNDEGLLKPK